LLLIEKAGIVPAFFIEMSQFANVPILLRPQRKNRKRPGDPAKGRVGEEFKICQFGSCQQNLVSFLKSF